MVRAVALIQRHRRQHRVSFYHMFDLLSLSNVSHESANCSQYILLCFSLVIRNYQEHPSVLVSSSDDEIEQAALPPQPHIIHLL